MSLAAAAASQKRWRNNNMTDTVYVTAGTGNPADHTAFIKDAMGSYDVNLYRAEIAAGRIDDLVEEEWTHVWTYGDNAHDTEAAALAAIDADYDLSDRSRVVAVDRDLIRAALLSAFGAQSD